MTSGLLDTSVFIARETDRAWARLVIDCRHAGVHRTVRLTDALIAATAVVHGLPVVTQDDDFERIAAAHPALRVHRV